MTMLKNTFVTLSISLGLQVTALAAEVPAAKPLDCHAHGGGYIVQDVKVNKADDAYTLALQRFSPVPDMVPNVGLKFDNALNREAVIKFPAKLCRTKPTALPHVNLFACSTGISKVNADLTSLDGKKSTIVLPDNFYVEVEQVDVNSVSRLESTVHVKLSNEAALGFRLHECK